ncbi:MAG: stress response translation initiation inhibitor YciH [Sinobacterium sp.]|nr:stress response translation initiation inhibitor YciH [Sinobacterium sp.]
MAKVYSTEFGRLCAKCGGAEHDGRCANAAATMQGDGRVRIQRETKGRKGAGVTLVTGIPLAEKELKLLHKKLKKKCGVGGTLKNGVLELQGDQRELLLAELSAKGWDVKIAGA